MISVLATIQISVENFLLQINLINEITIIAMVSDGHAAYPCLINVLECDTNRMLLVNHFCNDHFLILTVLMTTGDPVNLLPI